MARRAVAETEEVVKAGVAVEVATEVEAARAVAEREEMMAEADWAAAEREGAARGPQRPKSRHLCNRRRGVSG